MGTKQSQVGVVIAQLGTPDAPTSSALRPYLKQFLSDMRVIDYPPLLWQSLLNGVILNTRPRRSSRLYQRIWTEEGSPLLVYTQRQVEGVQTRLGESFRVVMGMTYGNPSLSSAIRGLEDDGIHKIIVFPTFPQFSSTTTASIYDAVYTAAAGRRCPLFHERKRFVPTLRFIAPYYDHSAYIEAMRQRIAEAVSEWGTPPDLYLFTFHGIPERYIRTGDPYREQCEATAHLLAQALSLSDTQWRISFQSRFGPEPWLQPYTDEVIEAFPSEHHGRLLVFSPGFVTDCLETLDELGNEGLESFEKGGGHAENFKLVPCLNDASAWLDTMSDIIRHEAQGWC